MKTFREYLYEKREFFKQIERDAMAETKVYVKNPSDIPEGAQIKHGPRGGFFYDVQPGQGGPKSKEPAGGPKGPSDEREPTGHGPKEPSPDFALHITNSLRSKVAELSGTLSTSEKSLLHQVIDTLQPQIKEAMAEGTVSKDKTSALSALFDHAFDSVRKQSEISYTRTLGDHGFRHIMSNINRCNQIMDELQKNGIADITAQDRILATLTHLYHDIGFTAEKNVRGWDLSEHPQEGANMIKENGVYDEIVSIFGKDSADTVTDWIAHHATPEIDWDERPIMSSIALSDNLAIFAKEKMPKLFGEMPEAFYGLEKIQKLKQNNAATPDVINTIIKEVKTAIWKRFKNDPVLAEQLVLAAQEINVDTPKFTLGMWAGEMEKLRMKDRIMEIDVKSLPYEMRLQKVFDMGQNGFGKLAKTYGIIDFSKKEFKFKNKDGKIVMRARLH